MAGGVGFSHHSKPHIPSYGLDNLLEQISSCRSLLNFHEREFKSYNDKVIISHGQLKFSSCINIILKELKQLKLDRTQTLSQVKNLYAIDHLGDVKIIHANSPFIAKQLELAEDRLTQCEEFNQQTQEFLGKKDHLKDVHELQTEAFDCAEQAKLCIDRVKRIMHSWVGAGLASAGAPAPAGIPVSSPTSATIATASASASAVAPALASSSAASASANAVMTELERINAAFVKRTRDVIRHIFANQVFQDDDTEIEDIWSGIGFEDPNDPMRRRIEAAMVAENIPEIPVHFRACRAFVMERVQGTSAPKVAAASAAPASAAASADLYRDENVQEVRDAIKQIFDFLSADDDDNDENLETIWYRLGFVDPKDPMRRLAEAAMAADGIPEIPERFQACRAALFARVQAASAPKAAAEEYKA